MGMNHLKCAVSPINSKEACEGPNIENLIRLSNFLHLSQIKMRLYEFR